MNRFTTYYTDEAKRTKIVIQWDTEDVCTGCKEKIEVPCLYYKGMCLVCGGKKKDSQIFMFKAAEERTRKLEREKLRIQEQPTSRRGMF